MLWGCVTLCDPVLLWVITVVYLLESVPLYLALSEFLQQHQLGLLQSQLLLQLLNDALPLCWAALLHSDQNVTYTTTQYKRQKHTFQLL